MARELMICIAMETGETFNPAIGYPNATGLIQLTDIAITEMNKTRHKGKYNGGINFTKDNLKEMTVERQLDFVKYYFQMNLDNGKTVSNALDMYMCIWCPAAVGKDNNYVCYQRGTSAYTGNLSIDGETYDEKTHKIKATSKKGHITKGDLLPRYKEKKWNGELMMWMNISKCSESPSEEETPKDGMVSKYLSYTEAVSSDTATRHKLDNSPTKEHLENIKALGYNIYDKLYEQFNGNIIPSSVYRSDAVNAEIKGASTTSQHLNGEAMDIDNISPTKNKNIYKYIINNLEYDQIIWEYGDEENPEWVHVSYKKDGNNRYKQTRAIRDENKQTKYIDFNIKLDK
ncbi:MAG: hypothetical protein LBV74_22260 [Tannerella sp.]|nr:hypothetical protein [Tannerella sp.]